jgi:hypothetical protein
MKVLFEETNNSITDPSDRAVEVVGLRQLTCWDSGFESHRRFGCLSLVSVTCCEVEISALGRSLVQRSPTECGVSNECDRNAPKGGGGCAMTRNRVKAPQGKK